MNDKQSDQPDQPDQSDQPDQPQSIGSYTVQDTLGAGGMAVVYRAVQTSLDREVAVKVLPAAFSDDADAIARFERESTLVAKLTHPGIIQIYDRGTEEGRFYIVMEYVRGCSLEDLIRDRQLSINEIIDIGLQISRALGYAHSKGVVHRDIKPGNILVSSDSGMVKVADFGIAQFAEAQLVGDTLTREHTGMGTINYMAPEQRLDARSVDGRADIFSFGVILYEMLTGRLPLGHFKTPIELRDDTPPKLSNIVVRCLEGTPADRYHSFDFLIRDLEKVTVLSLDYREALGKMAATVRRMSGKTSTRWMSKARRVLEGRAWRLVRAAIAAVLVITLVVVGFRTLIGNGDGNGGDGTGSGGTSTVRVSDAFAARLATAEELRARGAYADAFTSLRAIRTEARDAGDEAAWGDAQWRVAEIHREIGNVDSGAIAYTYFYNTFATTESFRNTDRVPAALYWAAHFKETQKERDYRGALIFYKKLSTDFPRHSRAAEAIFRIAYLMDEEVRPPRGTNAAGYYGRAAELYRQVVDEYPDSPLREDAFRHLGQMYEGRKQIRNYGRAAETYEQMAAAYPTSAHDPLFMAARVVDRKLKDTPRAIRLYEAFLAARPGSENADDARSRLRRLR